MTISAYIYAIHDKGGQYLMGSNKGWIVITRDIGLDGGGGEDCSSLSNEGYGIIVRLNHGYNPNGTIPYEAQYPQFAAACARFVQASSGVDFWIIGNETNGPREWPGNVPPDPYSGEPITVARYVSCYIQCYNAIRAVAPNAKICPSGVGTWGPPLDGSHPAFPNKGVKAFLPYWVDCLNGIGADKIDALILHAYTHGCDPAMVTSEAKAGDPAYADIHWHFRVYRDYMGKVPPTMKTKPVLITECDQVTECADNNRPRNTWKNENSGWVKAIYAEINQWNATSGTQKIWCVALFRWEVATEDNEFTFTIQDKPNIHNDFREAVAFGYKWGTPAPPTGGGDMTDADPSGTNFANLARSATQVTTSSNYGSDWTGAKAIDGVVSKESKWTSQQGVNPPHWLQLDLGADRRVNGYIVKHAGAEGSDYITKAFSIQSLSSNGTWTNDTVVDNSARSNQTNRKYTSPRTLRYVRLYITQPSFTDSFARIPEFEVWGEGAPPPPSGDMIDADPSGTNFVNLARSATQVTTSSNFGSDNTGAKAIDGVVSQASKWTSQRDVNPPHWLQLDLGGDRRVNGYIVKHAGAESSDYITKAFSIQSLSSTGTWTDETVVDNSARANQTNRKYPSLKTLRYVRLYITQPSFTDSFARIPEFEVWGEGLPQPQPSAVGVDLEVPYVHQLTEIGGFNGAPACGPACAVMVLAAMQRLSPVPTQVPRPISHLDDWAYYVSKSYSVEPQFSGSFTFDASQLDGSNRPAQGAYGACVINQVAYAYKIYQYLDRHDVGYHYEDAAARITPENLKRELDGGALVILATYIAGDPGHLIVLRGYDSQGDFIVNDPNGNYANGTWTGSGERVTYSWQKICGSANRKPLYYLAAYGPQYLPRADHLTLAVQNDGPATGQLDIRFLALNGAATPAETRGLGSGASTTIAAPAAPFSGTAVIRARHTGLGALAVELGSDANLDNLAQAIGPAALGAFGRIARKLHLPAVYSRIFNYNTSVRIMNAGLATATDVLVRLVGRAGYGDGQATFSLAPGASVDVALTSLIGTNPWTGSAVITASQALAVSSRDTDMTTGAARTSSGASTGAATLYAPVVYRESYGLSSGIVVQNLGDTATTVDVDLRNRIGTLRYTHTFSSIAPLRADGIFLPKIIAELVPDGWPKDGWAGTAVIRSRNGQPLAAQVSGAKPNAGVATYNAVTAGSQRVVIPRVIKAIGGRSTSFLMQSTEGALTVKASYLNPSGGTPALVADYTIQPLGGAGQFVGNETRLPDGWSGSIILEASAASLAVVVREDSTTSVSSANALPGKGVAGPAAPPPAGGGITEDFTTMPAWSSSADAGWGVAASWTTEGGGPSGNCLKATRSGAGSSAKVKIYGITPNTAYTISVYMNCAGGAGYWVECAYRLGNNSATDFDNNSDVWTKVNKFSDTGPYPNGNSGTWVLYSQSFNSGSNTQISIGFKSGSSAGAGPTAYWDTLKIA